MKLFSTSGFLALFAVACALTAFPCAAAPGDEHWDPQFNWPGTTNAIFAIAVDGQKIYAGGNITSGTLTNAPLEVWDGYQWSTMGVFNFGTSLATATIDDLAVFGGKVYVAGAFTNINGAAIRSLAVWDGATWNSAGLTGTTLSLAVAGNNLYAAGAFTNVDAGGVMMTNVGYFDGSAWHALGSGVGTPGSGNAKTIAVKNGLVYAGGIFTNCGAVIATNLAVWNGSTWSAVGGGVGGPFTAVYCLAFNGNDLYAGGSFASAGATTATNLARWDGTNWFAVGGGLNSASGSQVTGLGVLNGSVLAAGTFTNAGGIKVTNFASWDGSAWSGAAGISANGYRVTTSGNLAYVGGNFLLAGNKLMNGIAAWDGTTWSPIGTPGQINGVNSSVRALAGDGTNAYAGGPFNWVGQTNVNSVARFDGSNWYPLGNGITSSGASVNCLAVSNNNVYVGGSFSSAGGVSVANIARWDGSGWSALGTPGGFISAIMVRPEGVYATGAPFFNLGPNYASPFLLRWDGSAWQGVLNYPMYTDTAFYLNDANIGMSSVAVIGTNIFVGGHFIVGQYANTNNFTGYTSCSNILRFNGSEVRTMGIGLNNIVTAMAVLNSNLYVIGTFTNAGGVAASKIAMWNGGYWTNVGSGLVGSGSLTALAVVGNNLYVGGSAAVTNLGGVTVSHVAKWDGTNWSALGSGTTYPGLNSGPVGALAAAGNDLYVGGTFRQAGGLGAFNLARWNDQKNFYTPQLSALYATNNTLRMHLTGAGGQTNLILATTNFTAWTPVATNTSGIFDFTDTNAAYHYRYYRAMLGP